MNTSTQIWLLVSVTMGWLSACQLPTTRQKTDDKKDSLTVETIRPPHLQSGNNDLPGTIKEVPVLCYHQIRDYRTSDNGATRSYTVTPAAFEAQMKTLHDSGYQSILPDALYAHLTQDKPLPGKPVLISFDDGSSGQYTAGAKIMDQFGFKGVFFIMTVATNKAGYLSETQLQALVKEGHVVGNHTWDHQNVTSYGPEDWAIQIEQPAKTLKEITGNPVEYFAYPYGVWDTTTIAALKSRGYKLAFSLHTPKHPNDSLFTVRRVMASGSWTSKSMLKAIEQTFD